MPAYQPAELVDTVPGNIGIVDPGESVVLLHFDEPTALQPSDSMGNLDDLTIEPGITVPESAQTWSGFGRQFVRASLNALMASDITGRDTLLQKNATIQWLGSLTLTGAAGPHTIIARGLNDGSIAEQYSIGLELEEQAGDPGQVDIRMFWQDSAGAIKVQTAGTFTHPGDGKEILFTATRRWAASDLVVVRYYVNDELLAEVSSVDGDISGGTTARTTIGARKEAGVWGDFLNGTIDELLVTDHEMSHEEVRHTYKRLTEYQPGGVETYAGLAPVGLDWYKNPDSSIGRLVKISGLALGFTVALVEELLLMWLPDKAPLVHIARWERLCGLSAKPRDSLDVRRARVVAYLQREEGFSHPAIKAALATVMDEIPEDIELLEFTNELLDGFDELDDERWLANPIGTWSIVAGELALDVPAATDMRWSAVRSGCFLRLSLNTGGGDFYAAVKMADYSGLPVSCFAGLVLENRVTSSSLWFGVYNNAGSLELGYKPIIGGVEGAFVVLDAAPAGPLWLRFSPPPTDVLFGGVGTYRFGWSSIGANTGFTTEEETTGVSDLQWAGMGAFSTIASPATDLAVTFDDFRSFCPSGVMPFHWYVYRDPALLGELDAVGTQLLIQKIKPAHTYAALITSRSIVCDDEVDGRCDRGPVGGF